LRVARAGGNQARMPDTPRPPGPATAADLLGCAQTILRLYAQLDGAGWDGPALGRVRAAYELATRLFAGRLRASGNTFLAHLVGTASITAHLVDDPELVLAALLHAAYAVGDFGDGVRGAGASHRAAVADVVGDAAEAVVAAYQELDWVPAAVARHAADAATASPATRRLLLLRLANELEDHCDRAMLLSGAARRARWAASFPAMEAMAHALGWPALAAALARVAAENYGPQAVVPEGLVGTMAGSYVVLPASAVPPAPAAPPAPPAASGWRRLLCFTRARAAG
jgi:(p)ppGpp synthase/HD superfamily hydrolase